MNEIKQAKHNKKLSTILVIIIVLVSFMAGYFSHLLVQKTSLMGQVIDIINSTSFIVDPHTGTARDFTEEDYVNAMASAMLDKYSEYYSPEEYALRTNQDDGNYSGLGFETYIDSPQIVRVVGNSPADIAGVKKGQVLIGAKYQDGQRVDFNSVSDISEYFATNSDKQTFTLYFEDGSEITLSRAQYQASYITYFDNQTKLYFRENENDQLVAKQEQSDQMNSLPDSTGYIKLDLFEGGVASQFATAINYMLDSGKTKLILDLRDNGGGRVGILTEIASYLINNQGASKSLVMKTEERSGNDNYYTSSNNFDTRLQKVIVLANHNTASASECLIGAMLCYGDSFDKDGLDLVIEKNGQGVAKTYGKGVMQTTYILLNGGAFKLTTGRVLWPDGRCIHGTGIIATGENAVERGLAVNRAIQIASAN